MHRARTWLVSGLGAIVSVIGALAMRDRRRSRLGSGVLGFGLAHVLLGILDRATSRVR